MVQFSHRNIELKWKTTLCSCKLNFAYLEHVLVEIGSFLVFLGYIILNQSFVPLQINKTVQKSNISYWNRPDSRFILLEFTWELSSLFLSTYLKYVGLCTKSTNNSLVLFLRVCWKKRLLSIFFLLIIFTYSAYYNKNDVTDIFLSKYFQSLTFVLNFCLEFSS